VDVVVGDDDEREGRKKERQTGRCKDDNNVQ
jgi:hypothetical protein